MFFNALHHLKNVFYAARFLKNLPLLFIFLSGGFLSKPQNYTILILASISILFSSFFMTHINVITDYELDKIKKPSYYNALAKNWGASKIIIMLELIITLVCLTILIFLDYEYTSLFILFFNIAAISYSFNFFSRSPKEKRLKVYWWGHFLVMIVGYTSLWLAGLSVSNQFNSRTEIWLLLFLLVSLSEYGVFLLESSIDFNEEVAFNLKSMSSLIGENNTIMLSGIIGFISILFSIFLALEYSWLNEIYFYAFLPSMLIRLICEIFVIFVTNAEKRQQLKKYIPDILFIGTRLYTLLAILILIK